MGSSPAVANGVVYVGSEDNNVYALDAATGALLWSYTLGHPVESSPAVANGIVYIGHGAASTTPDENNVYAFSEKGALAFAPTQRPDPSTLHPDLSLSISKPAPNVLSNPYND